MATDFDRRTLVQLIGLASVGAATGSRILAQTGAHTLPPQISKQIANLVSEEGTQCLVPYSAHGSIIDWMRGHVRVFGRNHRDAPDNIGGQNPLRNWRQMGVFVPLPRDPCYVRGHGSLAKILSEHNGDYPDAMWRQPHLMTALLEMSSDRPYFPSLHDHASVKRLTAPLTNGVTTLPGIDSPADHPHWLRAVFRDKPAGTPSDYVAINNVLSRNEHPDGACLPDKNTLVLQDGRFIVRVDYDATAFNAGAGSAFRQQIGANSGGFNFFSGDNLEILSKVHDGRELNDAYWLFAAGLTNVGVTLRVTDRWTGTTHTYENPSGTAFPTIQNVNEFVISPALEPKYFRAEYPELGAVITDIERYGLPTTTDDNLYRDAAHAERDAFALYSLFGANDPDMYAAVKPFDPANPPAGFEAFAGRQPVSKNAYAVTVDQHSTDYRGIVGKGPAQQLVGMVVDFNVPDESNVVLYQVPEATALGGEYAEGGFRFLRRNTGDWADFVYKITNVDAGWARVSKMPKDILNSVLDGSHPDLVANVGFTPSEHFADVDFLFR